ncbi:MAG: Mut7-C RNAse domain-containing protein [Thermoplasmata archaeon]
MDEPKWLVDEMLGRLSRYLRFLGYDTEYVHGLTDDAVVLQAQNTHRRVLTRDHALARRSPDSILLTHTDIAGQMQELGRAFPQLRHDVRFDRCSVCNGPLAVMERVPQAVTHPPSLPPEIRDGRIPVHACSRCGHLYWEGSHTRAVRSRLTGWFPVATVSG